MSDNTQPPFTPELLAQLGPAELRALDELLAATVPGSALDAVLPTLPLHVRQALLFHVERAARSADGTHDLDALQLPLDLRRTVNRALRDGTPTPWTPLLPDEHAALSAWVEANWRTMPDVVTTNVTMPASYCLTKLRAYDPANVATYAGIYELARLLHPHLDDAGKAKIEFAHAKRRKELERRQPPGT